LFVVMALAAGVVVGDREPAPASQVADTREQPWERGFDPGEVSSSVPSQVPRATFPSARALDRARRYAKHRAGLVSFAVIDTGGGAHHYRGRARYASASVIKAMFLVAYLRKVKAEGRDLTSSERALLDPMIRVSDNDAAASVYGLLGSARVERVARAAGMRFFEGIPTHWASGEIAALDQARFFARLEQVVPGRFYRYARRLLRTIVDWQTWGIPAVARPRGYRVFFKTGRRTSPSLSGVIVHQVARLERGRRVFTLAVFTDRQPSDTYGIATVRGIAERLLGVKAARPRRGKADRPNGRLLVVEGSSEKTGAGPLKRFTVDVEDGLAVDRHAFAAFVKATLAEERGWAARDDVAFQRVSQEPVSFRVILASPATTDRLCAPLRTNSLFSCFMRGRAVLNVRRWRTGASSYGHALAAYRRYLVNHEVGHALGYEHAACPGTGHRAPVMMQQTKGVAPCRPNAWPLPEERQ
jgi:Protein of unknown function (DUF3152)